MNKPPSPFQTPFPLPPALCDSRRSGSYRRHTPSKQHLLCGGSSAAEVVLRHPDFRRARRRAKKKVGLKSRFRLILEKDFKARFVVVAEMNLNREPIAALKVNKSLVTEAAAVTTRDIFRRPQPSTVPRLRLVLPPVPLKTVLVLDVSQVQPQQSCNIMQKASETLMQFAQSNAT